MKKKKLFAIILNALTLLNFLVGGLLGFILIKGEDLKIFRFIFFLCLGATIFCLLCSWLLLRLTKTGKKYYKLRLRSGILSRNSTNIKVTTNGRLSESSSC